MGEDIIQTLGLRKDGLFTAKASFDRPNLKFFFRPRIHSDFSDLLPVLEKYSKHNDSVIIYVRKKKDCEEIVRYLNLNGKSATFYHASMSNADRSLAHSEFATGKKNILVGTVAYGMGIDSQSVRLVIHFGLASSIESYYQEAGRGGRDGLPAVCLSLVWPKDLEILRFFLSSLSDGIALEIGKAGIAAMEKLAFGSECRRKVILAKFGEIYEKVNCGGCDICLAELGKEGEEKKENVDVTTDAQLVVAIISFLSNATSNSIVACAIGSKSGTKKFPLAAQQSFFGAGSKTRSEDFWKEVIKINVFFFF